MGQEKASVLEENTPWEVKLLQDYCKTVPDLDTLGYAKKSVLAAAWFICFQTPPTRHDECLCGEGRLEECVVRQWVEFYLVRIKMETVLDTLSKDELQAVLKELNEHLASRIFMVSYKLCLADILLFYGLHRYLDGMSFGQKSNFVHVSRWFDQVQHFPDVRPFSLPLVVFCKNPDLLRRCSNGCE